MVGFSWLSGLGPRHAKYQKRIVELLFLPVIFNVLWEVSIHPSRAQAWLTLRHALIYWVVLAAPTLVFFYLASRAYNIDLHFYYRLWLPKIKPLLSKLSLRELDIVDSFAYFMPNDTGWRGKRPCFVEREDLARTSFWHGWVFSIVTLFGDQAVRQDVGEDITQQKLWTLQVSLMDEGYGIYSNQGKKFLHDRFLTRNREAGEEVIKRSIAFYELMKPAQRLGATWLWNEFGTLLPMRWASGGILPLVRYQGDYWVLLFFRDRPPVGLNVPNGASECKDEYKDPWRLIDREFNEEVVVLSGRPLRGSALLQRDFLGQFQIGQFLTSEFAAEHAQLRETTDDIKIDRGGAPRPVDFLKTPFRVKVQFHASNLEGMIRTAETRNVVYSMDPAESALK